MIWAIVPMEFSPPLCSCVEPLNTLFCILLIIMYIFYTHAITKSIPVDIFLYLCGRVEGMKPEEHSCEDNLVLVGALKNTHLCVKCGNTLCANEIEILNSYYEVGGFCNNEKCERFLILVV